MTFEEFVEVFKSLEGTKILETKNGPHFIVYSVNYEHVQKEIEKICSDLKGKFGIELSSKKLVETENIYKLFFGSLSLKENIKLFHEKLSILIKDQDEEMKIKHQQFGMPDLSLVTIHQMVTELKKRKNLVFSLVWIENSNIDNISVQGSGNPTQVVGLLARGTHMAIEWADKNIRFNK